MKKKLLGLCMVALVATGIVGCSQETDSDVSTEETAEAVIKTEGQEAMPLGIIGAMEEEVEILKEQMEISETVEVAGMTFYTGKLFGKDVVLVRSGVGKVNMAACTQILVDKFNVVALVNSGVSGTLDPELNQGDIVISTEAVQHDFDTTPVGGTVGEIERLGISFFEADQALIDVAMQAAANLENVNTKEGLVASGDQFVAGGELAARIKANFGEVSAVEMEGAAMAHVAYLNDVPFVIIRSISDKADGGAELSYEEFLPLAAKNSSDLVLEFVKLY